MLRALRHTRSHTVGYIGGCDHEKGEIEPVRTGAVATPSRRRRPRSTCVRVWGSGLGLWDVGFGVQSLGFGD